jgi:hypothetical protein
MQLRLRDLDTPGKTITVEIRDRNGVKHSQFRARVAIAEGQLGLDCDAESVLLSEIQGLDFVVAPPQSPMGCALAPWVGADDSDVQKRKNALRGNALIARVAEIVDMRGTGLSQAVVAQRLKLSQQYVSNLLAGARNGRFGAGLSKRMRAMEAR